MLLTLLQNRGDTPVPPVVGGGGIGFSMGSGIRQVSIKPMLQRILESRAPKVKPAKERAAKRAKAIEQQAAVAVVNGATESDLERFMRDWQAQKPVITQTAAEYPRMDLFLAQIAFRIEQMKLLQAMDDDDAILALLLL